VGVPRLFCKIFPDRAWPQPPVVEVNAGLASRQMGTRGKNRDLNGEGIRIASSGSKKHCGLGGQTRDKTSAKCVLREGGERVWLMWGSHR